MLEEIFGPDLLVVGAFLLISAVGLIITLWAIIDAAGRPSMAFTAAGTSKALWITLIAVLFFFTGVIGFILAIVYLASIRPRVKAATIPYRGGVGSIGHAPGWWMASDGNWYPPERHPNYAPPAHAPPTLPPPIGGASHLPTQPSSHQQEQDLAVFRGPVPGWYRDPKEPTVARYWDGTALGEERRPMGTPPPMPTSPPSP
jgi:Protein of unknown function (DUF2516)/Protein of unknown function (DUF2510)